MEFTKENLKKIDDEVIAAVKAITAKYGVEARMGGGTYSTLQATIRIKLTTTSATGETPEQRDWKRHAKIFGLEEAWLGRAIRVNGKPGKIAGLLPNRPKFCVLVALDTGKRILVPATTAIKQLSDLSLAAAKATQPPALTLVEPPTMPPVSIRVSNTVRESLPNYKADWCTHKHDKTEDEVGYRYMERGSCACGVHKEHVHRNDCGLITQVG